MTDTTYVGELLLTQHEHDRTLYELPGVGQLRTGGYFGGAGATITVAGVTWQCARESLWAHRYCARDKAGTLDGRYSRPWLGARRGLLEWAGRTYAMPAASASRPHFTLRLTGGDLIAMFSASKTNTATPVRVEVLRPLRPDLLMFATYVAAEFAARAARSGGQSGSGGGEWFDGSGADGGGCGGGGGCSGGGGGCGGGGCGGGS